MSGDAKDAKRPLERPLDEGVLLPKIAAKVVSAQLAYVPYGAVQEGQVFGWLCAGFPKPMI